MGVEGMSHSHIMAVCELFKASPAGAPGYLIPEFLGSITSSEIVQSQRGRNEQGGLNGRRRGRRSRRCQWDVDQGIQGGIGKGG